MLLDDSFASLVLLLIFKSLMTAATNERTENVSENWNVDVLIDTLLTSNNFVRLLDVVAEKTARKIRYYENRSRKEDDKEEEETVSEAREEDHGNDVQGEYVTENKLMLKYKHFTKNIDKENERSRRKDSGINWK